MVPEEQTREQIDKLLLATGWVVQDLKDLNVAEYTEHVFSPEGKLSSLNGFEYRPQQHRMAQAIADALENNSHLLVEAPSGVGKSLAYLVPAIVHAIKNKRKAVISTHTKTLQEQLLRKDLRIVRSLLDFDFEAVTFKGRSNYLCTTRLRNALASSAQLFDTGEMEELTKIAQWSKETENGDVENLPFALRTNVRQQVCSEKGACSRSICGPMCFFQRARERARRAHLVIMNHALFFTLLSIYDAEEHFLFEDDFVVFDEAHTLELVAGQGIGKSITRAQVLFAIHRLYNPKTKKGLLLRGRFKKYHRLCEEVERSAIGFFDEVKFAVQSQNSKSTTFRVREAHFVNDTLTQPLHDLQSTVKELEEEAKLRISKEELAAAKRLLREAEVLVKGFLDQLDLSLTYWVELSTGRNPNVTLNATPTNIADSIAPRLFKSGTSVVMTSATLSINGSLEYFQQRLGALAADTLVLGSPFDFRRQMKLVLARDIPPPDDPQFEKALPDWVYHCVARSRGKALVLFTSMSLLRKAADQLRGQLEADGIKLLIQDGKRSRHSLLEEFKRDIHSVLFGLDSFWMGIDVPGEALEHVIITRLPFAVPDHPLIESRIELIEQQGGNAFSQYTLPEAILKFRQGVGRLIRTKTDTGLVTILDSRILSKRYGKLFLQSIPECPVEMLSSCDAATEFEEVM